jgi:pimeloyl-ACP methyl ester carboxylesterase/DNA-binding CsgD family transcriptional regulator
MATRESIPQQAPPQEIRFCRGRDGVRIAYSTHGSGPPLVIVSCWLSHLERDWESPIWRHFLEQLGGVAHVTRYDERGFGLSDWRVVDFSLEARVADLEALVTALGFDRFALLGMSGGAPVAMAFAARHPEPVTRLVLYGTSGAGCLAETEEDDLEEEAFLALMRAGWARPESTFRRVFSSLFVPDASEEQMRWLDELQRVSTSTENAIASRLARRLVDVTRELGSIRCPTLVLQARRDPMVGFESGLAVAERIPGARLVPLDSRNHILLEDEAAWPVFIREVAAFLEPDARAARSARPAEPPALTVREREVLSLAADGRSNEQIAGELGLSVRTVERHLSNVYVKLGISGKAARAAAVAALLGHPPAAF